MDEAIVLRVPGSRMGVDIAPGHSVIDVEDGRAAAVRGSLAGDEDMLRPAAQLPVAA